MQHSRTEPKAKDTPMPKHTAAEDMKPCPFCGMPAELNEADGFVWIGCSSTHIDQCAISPMTLEYRPRLEAIAAWNRRAHTVGGGDDSSPAGGECGAAAFDALKPFAAFADALNEAVPDDIAIGIYADGAMRFGPNGGVTVGSLRKARAALSQEGLVAGADGWRDIASAPKDGSTIEVRAVMRAHHMQGAKFAIMPKDWRPDTPLTEWRLTEWREVAPPSGQQAAQAEAAGIPKNGGE